MKQIMHTSVHSSWSGGLQNFQQYPEQSSLYTLSDTVHAWVKEMIALYIPVIFGT
jgi:hypothetical protein